MWWRSYGMWQDSWLIQLSQQEMDPMFRIETESGKKGLICTI
jgi:hypothetical protein